MYELNKTCKKVSASFVNISDESINDIFHWNTVKGGLPHWFFIFFQTEPLGTQFKTMEFYFTGLLLFLEIRRLKEGMKSTKYHRYIRATTSCAKSIMEQMMVLHR